MIRKCWSHMMCPLYPCYHLSTRWVNLLYSGMYYVRTYAITIMIHHNQNFIQSKLLISLFFICIIANSCNSNPATQTYYRKISKLSNLYWIVWLFCKSNWRIEFYERWFDVHYRWWWWLVLVVGMQEGWWRRGLCPHQLCDWLHEWFSC